MTLAEAVERYCRGRGLLFVTSAEWAEIRAMTRENGQHTPETPYPGTILFGRLVVVSDTQDLDPIGLRPHP